MPTHLLYVDDSGTKEYAALPTDYGKGNSRYFVFGGVLLPFDAASVVSEAVQRLKRRCFGSADVEIKSTWLRQPEKKESKYLARGVTNERLTAFVNELYALIDGSDLMLIAGVIDKVDMVREYPRPYHPSAVAYEVLMQRVEQELEGRGTVAVTMDDMSGATPKHNQFKDNLKQQHDGMRKAGSKILRGFKYSTLEGRLRFMNSAHSGLIQIADLTAYNVFRQFTDYGGQWEQEGLNQLPTYEYLTRTIHKYRDDGNGRVQGYGIAKFPMVQRIHWTVDKKKSKAAP
jgi:hypothetical protein